MKYTASENHDGGLVEKNQPKTYIRQEQTLELGSLSNTVFFFLLSKRKYEKTCHKKVKNLGDLSGPGLGEILICF